MYVCTYIHTHTHGLKLYHSEQQQKHDMFVIFFIISIYIYNLWPKVSRFLLAEAFHNILNILHIQFSSCQ